MNLRRDPLKLAHGYGEAIPTRDRITLSGLNVVAKEERTMSIRRERLSKSTKRSEGQGGMSNELHELFLDELADIYNAEQQLTKALPKLAKAAKSEELRETFEMHLEETRNQINRLEQVAESVGGAVKRKKCQGMEGLIEEGEEMMDEKEDSAALDAALILAPQKVEHYEIASYGG